MSELREWIATIAPIATAIGVVVAIFTAYISYEQSTASYEQSVDNARSSLRRQANIAAMQMIESHYRFAAEKGIGLSGMQAKRLSVTDQNSEERSDQEITEKLVAQHGLLTANLAFDLTEETLEHNEMKGVAGLLLKRYQEDIEQAGFPCMALDDEFVKDFARKEVGVDPCKGKVQED